MAIINTFIGGVQGLLGTFVIPHLAQRLTSRKHAYTTLGSLLVNCLFPAAVIIGLDAACLGNWVTLWGPCTQNDERLNVFHRMGNKPVQVLTAHEFCSPWHAQATASMPWCFEVTLLRLQTLWVGKLIFAGLLIPAGRITAERSEKESGEVVGKVTILLAYATICSGHLPLVILLIPVAMLGEIVLAIASWMNGHLRIRNHDGIAGPSSAIFEVLAATVQLTSSAERPHVLAMIIIFAITSGFAGMGLRDTLHNWLTEHLCGALQRMCPSLPIPTHGPWTTPSSLQQRGQQA